MNHAARPLYTSDEVLPALREHFSHHPVAVTASPDKLARMLCVLRFLSCQPDVCEVEEALEALQIEGELAA